MSRITMGLNIYEERGAEFEWGDRKSRKRQSKEAASKEFKLPHSKTKLKDFTLFKRQRMMKQETKD